VAGPGPAARTRCPARAWARQPAHPGPARPCVPHGPARKPRRL